MNILIILFTLFFGSLVPLLMLFMGIGFKKNPSCDIGGLGYKTELSCKNEDTWLTAQQITGEVWTKTGAVMEAVSLAVLITASLFLSGDPLLIFLAAATMVQAGILVFTIVVIERRLRKIFDENGDRR